MTTYDEILEACQHNNISLRDVDRLVLQEDAYDEFHERTAGTNVSPANYQTSDAPAVRLTTGDEYMLWVDSAGFELRYEF